MMSTFLNIALFGIFLAFSIPFIPSALVNYAYVQMKLPTRTRDFSATNWNDSTLRYLYVCQVGICCLIVVQSDYR